MIDLKFPHTLNERANLRRVAPDLAVGAALAPLLDGHRWSAVLDLHGPDRHWPEREARLGALAQHGPVLRMTFADATPIDAGVFSMARAVYRARRAQGPVLVCCFAGRSRSASVAAALLALEGGLAWDEAVRRVSLYDTRGKLLHAPHPVSLESARTWVQDRCSPIALAR